MEGKSLQEKQDFVATVEEKQQDGEWVVTAQAVGTLKELTEWAANGVGVGSRKGRAYPRQAPPPRRAHRSPPRRSHLPTWQSLA